MIDFLNKKDPFNICALVKPFHKLSKLCSLSRILSQLAHFMLTLWTENETE